MIENWLPIKGFEGLYEVSDLGRIKVLEKRKGTNYSVLVPEGIKKPSNNGNYFIVTICKNSTKFTRFVHRLVAQHFIDNALNLPEVNHIDGDKLNCAAYNLEWCTRAQNEKHSYEKGLKHTGAMWGNSKAVIQYTLSGQFIKEWACFADIKRAHGFDRRVISRCCKGLTNMSHGFIWKYK